MPLFVLILLTVFLVSPASAMSFRIDDPLTEVHYDVLAPDGSVYLSDQNSTSIANLGADGHYRSGMPRAFIQELRGDSRGEAIDVYDHIA